MIGCRLRISQIRELSHSTTIFVIFLPPLECVQCSSATDNNCLTGESILPTNCTLPGHQCFTQIVGKNKPLPLCTVETSSMIFTYFRGSDRAWLCDRMVWRTSQFMPDRRPLSKLREHYGSAWLQQWSLPCEPCALSHLLGNRKHHGLCHRPDWRCPIVPAIQRHRSVLHFASWRDFRARLCVERTRLREWRTLSCLRRTR